MPFPVDIQYVTATEQKLGVKFPASYVVRMVKSNGGSVQAGNDSWDLYPIFDASDRTRLKRTCNDVVRETQSAKGWPDFPPGAVAIAGNGTGDLLLFKPQADRPELLGHEVYWWDHETGALELAAEDFGDL